MRLKLKDPGSAITHGIALLLAIAGAAPLLIRAAGWTDSLHIAALSIFILTMILLYAASTIYHSVDSTEKVNRRLKKIDHMMIFVMIAGSYTPVCLIVLHNRINASTCPLAFQIVGCIKIAESMPTMFSCSSTILCHQYCLMLFFSSTPICP